MDLRGWLGSQSIVGWLLSPFTRSVVRAYHHRVCTSIVSLRDAVRLAGIPRAAQLQSLSCCAQPDAWLPAKAAAFDDAQ